MPETGIGFIPDVGGSWLLTRDGGAGIYMGLSGATVGPADAIDAGFADLCIESGDASQLISRLERCRRVEDVDAALLGFACGPGDGVLREHKALLDETMSFETVDAIVATLVAAGSVFASEAAQRIERNSPTSLRLTHELLKRAKRAENLESCLLQEFRAACALLDGHDLREGVRAAIVDKDKNPKWAPATLAEVDAATIAALLADRGDEPPKFEPWGRRWSS
jgi:enoyl-CoA hydratase